MKVTKEYKKQLETLLKECDRLDLWRYVLEDRPRPTEPSDFVEELIAEHPEKEVRKEFKIREDATF